MSSCSNNPDFSKANWASWLKNKGPHRRMRCCINVLKYLTTVTCFVGGSSSSHCLPFSAADPSLSQCHLHADTRGRRQGIARHSSDPATSHEGRVPLRWVLHSRPHWLTESGRSELTGKSAALDYVGLFWVLSHSGHMLEWLDLVWKGAHSWTEAWMKEHMA